jgi:drug/metabolite transporter (DMT)-like permease
LPAPLVALGSLAWATLFVLPVGAAEASMPGWDASLSVLYLGVAATGVAYLLYFGLIAGAGASKAVLVTYLVPSLALLYGAIFLDEEITAVALAGLALVLAGVALGTGTLGRSRRARRAEAASLAR